MRKQLGPFLVDVVAVVVFCAIGRRSHAEAGSLAGLAGTAWPFLAGLGAGWGATLLPRRDPSAVVPGGIIVWLSTLVVGMVLRVVSGQGTALSFVVVAGVVLGAFLLGWRGIRHIVSRRSPAASPSNGTSRPPSSPPDRSRRRP